MAGLGSSNVANTLLQTLQNLNSQSDQILMTRETANVVQSLISICAVLADSAEAVGESSSVAGIRQQLADYSNSIKDELNSLTELKKAIEANPQAPGLKERLIESGKKIADLTANMIVASENALVKKVIEDAKGCAKQARALILAVQSPFEVFFETCKQFGASSVALAKSLKELIAETEDQAHRQRIHRAYEEIRDTGTRLVRAASAAFESPGNKDLLAEVHALSRELAAKISAAISIAQPESEPGTESLSVSAPVIPIPVEPTTDVKSRTKTVRDPKQGSDILAKAQKATAINHITDTLDASTEKPSSPWAAGPQPTAKKASPAPEAAPQAPAAAPPSAPAPTSTSSSTPTPTPAPGTDRPLSPRPILGGARPAVSPRRSNPNEPPAAAPLTVAAPFPSAAAPVPASRTSATGTPAPGFSSPSPIRPQTASGSLEAESLRARNQQLEKENAQLKAALAEARREADAWRDEFDNLTKVINAVGQKMQPKRP